MTRMIGTTTGSIAVVTVGMLKVLMAVLERDSDGTETMTLIPHGTEIPAGKALGNVIVVVGVQHEIVLAEDDEDELVLVCLDSLLTTILMPQGVDN